MFVKANMYPPNCKNIKDVMKYIQINDIINNDFVVKLINKYRIICCYKGYPYTFSLGKPQSSIPVNQVLCISRNGKIYYANHNVFIPKNYKPNRKIKKLCKEK